MLRKFFRFMFVSETKISEQYLFSVQHSTICPLHSQRVGTATAAIAVVWQAGGVVQSVSVTRWSA